MLDMDDPDDVVTSAGKFTTAVNDNADGVRTLIDDDMVLNTRSDAALDRALTDKLAWIQDTFDSAVRESAGQAQATLDVTVAGTTALGNTDIDGGATVRNVSA